MKITAIESFCNEFVGFVRVTVEDGSQGWGQLSTYHSDISAQVLHRQVAPWALGHDEADLDNLLDLITEREHKFPGSYLRRAMGGLDTAIWDLRGKQQGKPVCEILGGTAGPLRAYASSMKRDITPQQEADRFKKLRDEKGFDAFKMRAGAEVGRNQDEWAGRTEEIIPTMRRALGPDVDLLIDANSCYSPARAIEIGHLLQENGFCHFEEPCPYWELEQTQEVTRALELDVTGGEQDCDLPTWQRMIDMKAVDILQPDILYLGGMCRSLRVVEMAKKAALPITPIAPTYLWSPYSPCICCALFQMPVNISNSRSKGRIIILGKKTCFWKTCSKSKMDRPVLAKHPVGAVRSTPNGWPAQFIRNRNYNRSSRLVITDKTPCTIMI